VVAEPRGSGHLGVPLGHPAEIFHVAEPGAGVDVDALDVRPVVEIDDVDVTRELAVVAAGSAVPRG